MARTKAKARRSPKSNEHRRNMKTPEGRKRNQEKKKRKHDERNASNASTQKQKGRPQSPPARKDQKNKEPLKEKEAEESMQSNSAPPPNTSKDPSASNSTDTPQILTELEHIHDVAIMSIISSSHIQQKVTRALDILSEYPAVPLAKSKVVVLHAKAPVASKMITIAEITKREIVKGGGKWFQYNKLNQIMEEQQVRDEKGKQKKNAGEDVSMAENEDEDGGYESEEEFETMKTPLERAIDGKPKVRAVPVMTIYLSRIRIDSLRKEYSEQTNTVS